MYKGSTTPNWEQTNVAVSEDELRFQLCTSGLYDKGSNDGTDE